MFVHSLIIIFGLALFEIISSVDNAIINAHVLKSLPDKYKKIFLTLGIFVAVFVIRGVLPFIIASSARDSRDILLLGGGVYLFMVFLSWLFMEEKKYAFLVEHFIHRQSLWFYAVASIFVTVIIYFAVKIHPILALSASIGTSAFFITEGFKKNASEKEKDLLKPGLSAWSKLIYLEVLDASFSVDGVIGAFAFTISIPLILIGNGLGAMIVRELTIRGINVIEKFSYLKNGAMYSVGFLGAIMVLESFGREYPFWLAPLNTFLLLGFFLWLSVRQLRHSHKKEHKVIQTS